MELSQAEGMKLCFRLSMNMFCTVDIISGQARIIRLFEILSGPGALSFFRELKARDNRCSVQISSGVIMAGSVL